MCFLRAAAPLRWPEGRRPGGGRRAGPEPGTAVDSVSMHPTYPASRVETVVEVDRAPAQRVGEKILVQAIVERECVTRHGSRQKLLVLKRSIRKRGYSGYECPVVEDFHDHASRLHRRSRRISPK